MHEITGSVPNTASVSIVLRVTQINWFQFPDAQYGRTSRLTLRMERFEFKMSSAKEDFLMV